MSPGLWFYWFYCFFLGVFFGVFFFWFFFGFVWISSGFFEFCSGETKGARPMHVPRALVLLVLLFIVFCFCFLFLFFCFFGLLFFIFVFFCVSSRFFCISFPQCIFCLRHHINVKHAFDAWGKGLGLPRVNGIAIARCTCIGRCRHVGVGTNGTHVWQACLSAFGEASSCVSGRIHHILKSNHHFTSRGTYPCFFLQELVPLRKETKVGI